MEIIHKERWIRFVKEDEFYKVQVKHWFKWKDVTFGPYRPMSVGLSNFKNKSIAELHFITCLAKGKQYTLQGL